VHAWRLTAPMSTASMCITNLCEQKQVQLANMQCSTMHTRLLRRTNALAKQQPNVANLLPIPTTELVIGHIEQHQRHRLVSTPGRHRQLHTPTELVVAEVHPAY
jgi:hypothetical protein